MPTSGGAYIAITASRKQISREIKRLMGNRDPRTIFFTAPKLEEKSRQGQMFTTGQVLVTLNPDLSIGETSNRDCKYVS